MTGVNYCYCHTCQREIKSLGIASHRASHRRRAETCEITYLNGVTKIHQYGDKQNDMRFKEYRKLPVAIKAIRLTEENIDDVPRLINNNSEGVVAIRSEMEGIKINTLEGIMAADVGDWIIQGIKGEFYPCKNDIFEATYEEVEERK